MDKYAIIVAGGVGKRMGGNFPKQFLELKELPILMHTLQRFATIDPDVQLILVLHQDYHEMWGQLCQKHNFQISHQVVAGGKERFHSVKKGLDQISNPDSLVAVHDAVRPFFSSNTLLQAWETASNFGSAIPCIPLVDSLREITEEKNHAVDRSAFRMIQTPQCFQTGPLKESYNIDFQTFFTDDASVFEHQGHSIQLTEGNSENIKITRPFDLKLAEILIDSDL